MLIALEEDSLWSRNVDVPMGRALLRRRLAVAALACGPWSGKRVVWVREGVVLHQLDLKQTSAEALRVFVRKLLGDGFGGTAESMDHLEHLEAAEQALRLFASGHHALIGGGMRSTQAHVAPSTSLAASSGSEPIPAHSVGSEWTTVPGAQLPVTHDERSTYDAARQLSVGAAPFRPASHGSQGTWPRDLSPRSDASIGAQYQHEGGLVPAAPAYLAGAEPVARAALDDRGYSAYGRHAMEPTAADYQPRAAAVGRGYDAPDAAHGGYGAPLGHRRSLAQGGVIARPSATAPIGGLGRFGNLRSGVDQVSRDAGGAVAYQPGGYEPVRQLGSRFDRLGFRHEAAAPLIAPDEWTRPSSMSSGAGVGDTWQPGGRTRGPAAAPGGGASISGYDRLQQAAAAREVEQSRGGGYGRVDVRDPSGRLQAPGSWQSGSAVTPHDGAAGAFGGSSQWAPRMAQPGAHERQLSHPPPRQSQPPVTSFLPTSLLSEPPDVYSHPAARPGGAAAGGSSGSSLLFGDVGGGARSRLFGDTFLDESPASSAAPPQSPSPSSRRGGLY
uniref:Uncharacterized protein n=1 Tax=Prasinoderma singulare TaxID=676789 RepID=A0A7S3BU90_9VIRI